MTENDTARARAAAEELMRQAALARREDRADEARRLFEEARLLYQACDVQAGVEECSARLSQLTR